MFKRLKQALAKRKDGPHTHAGSAAREGEPQPPGVLGEDAQTAAVRRLRTEDGFGRRRIAQTMGITEYAVRKIEDQAAAAGRPIPKIRR
jgi:DNA-binding XRE family transcriptional regulator